MHKITDRPNRVRSAMVPHVHPPPPKRRKVAVDKPEQARKPITEQHSIIRTSSTHVDSTAQVRSSSELSEPTLTSPSDGRTPHFVPTTIQQPTQAPGRPSTEQILAALKKLTTPGSSSNPIILLEDPPAPKLQQTPRNASQVESHMFQNRHRKPYSYNVFRPALVPRPANGSAFTGIPGHDMYRMRAAKTVTPGWHVGGPQPTRLDPPFELQYSSSTRYPASQPDTARGPARPKVQCFPPPLPAHLHHAALISLNEEQLRSKALQCVREYSRPAPRKRKTAEDPNETSASVSTDVEPPRRPPIKPTASSRTSSKHNPVTILPDPHPQLPPLVEQAALLTSLLHAYPRSADQHGLRDAMARLASVQNQRLADWLNAEVAQSRRPAAPHTPRVRSAAVVVAPRPRELTAAELDRVEMQRRDDEIRGFLSAGASIWQDGSGLSVVDVFSGGDAAVPGVGVSGG